MIPEDPQHRYCSVSREGCELRIGLPRKLMKTERVRRSELLTVKMRYVSFDEDDNGL